MKQHMKDCECGEEYDEMTGMMFCLTHKAWEQAITEKIKEAWIKERGKNMEKAAEASVKHGMKVWMAKEMKKPIPKDEIEKYKKDLKKAFMS